MKADDRRPELEERATACVAKELARWDVHVECKVADRCLAVGYTELGENEWATITDGLPRGVQDRMARPRDTQVADVRMGLV